MESLPTPDLQQQLHKRLELLQEELSQAVIIIRTLDTLLSNSKSKVDANILNETKRCNQQLQQIEKCLNCLFDDTLTNLKDLPLNEDLINTVVLTIKSHILKKRAFISYIHSDGEASKYLDWS
jgi:hypothetical protein